MTLPAPDTSETGFVSASAIAVRDGTWVARVKAGDERAFEAMFRAYRDDLVGFLESLLHSRETAQEIVQDLFLRIWQHRDLWELKGALNSYLFRAARNRAISHLRHERTEAAFRDRLARNEGIEYLAAHSEPADAETRAVDLSEAIARSIEALPERCREVFRLRRYHHLSNAQTAEVLQISPKTVEVQMTRALGFLRRRLADWGDI